MLRAEISPKRMLRSVATVLASSGDYCIADVFDAHGRVRRVEIAHADPSRREKLRIAAQDTSFEPDGRVARLLRSGGAEIASKVTQAVASERLADIVLLRDERVRSYMAAAVSVSGAPMAVLTIATTRPGCCQSRDDLAFLRVAADWTGLGLENALRRELQPRGSIAPPAADDQSTLADLAFMGRRARVAADRRGDLRKPRVDSEIDRVDPVFVDPLERDVDFHAREMLPPLRARSCSARAASAQSATTRPSPRDTGVMERTPRDVGRGAPERGR